MINFINTLTNEILSHIEFVSFVWDEAERQFNDCHNDTQWTNLTKKEQIEQYCYQYEHQLSDMNWKLIK